MLKIISTNAISKKRPEVQKKGAFCGEFWEAGYFVGIVGDKVTTELIRKYIRYQREQEKSHHAARIVLVCSVVWRAFH